MLVNVFDGSWNGGYLVDGGRNLLLQSKDIPGYNSRTANASTFQLAQDNVFKRSTSYNEV